MSIDDKSGIRRNICRCTRFLLMLWLLLITFLKKDNEPKTKNILFTYIPLERTLNLNFDFFHLFAVNRDLSHCAAVTVTSHDGGHTSGEEDRPEEQRD